MNNNFQKILDDIKKSTKTVKVLPSDSSVKEDFLSGNALFPFENIVIAEDSLHGDTETFYTDCRWKHRNKDMGRNLKSAALPYSRQEGKMIILITGASHTGKTMLAQKLLEKYKYPYLSIDHLKMGLIRSGNTTLTPISDDNALTDYLWPIVREMIKTAIENEQNLIVEGCYIPFNWAEDFEKEYLDEIRFLCLIMSDKYIENHFDDIRKFASVIEDRGEDEDCTPEMVRRDNARMLEQCIRHGAEYILIDEEYQVGGWL